MALHTTINTLKDLLNKITQDLHKAEGGNKAASQRVRTMTVRLEKIAKGYRKESIHSEKNTTKSPKKTAKKTAKSKPKSKATASTKLKPKSKSRAAIARPRAFSLKKPTAKLPARRASFR